MDPASSLQDIHILHRGAQIPTGHLVQKLINFYWTKPILLDIATRPTYLGNDWLFFNTEKWNLQLKNYPWFTKFLSSLTHTCVYTRSEQMSRKVWRYQRGHQNLLNQRTVNTMAKRTNNNIQNTTQKTKD